MNTKNPYPGLRPFEFEESHLFFGREGQSEELLSRLRRNHFVAVVGTSGSGKSSFVRAGLLPLLYGGFMFDAGANWRISVFRPGKSPIRNLATSLVCPAEFESKCADGEKRDFTNEEKLKVTVTETILRRSSVGLLDYATGVEFDSEENLLIVVDQFEELFRFRDKSKLTGADESAQMAEDEAAAFVKLLLEATRDKNTRIYVVITMRSDFLGDCAQFRNLPETINEEGQYLIPRLVRDQLRQVIEAPAKVHGVQMTTALVTRLLNDIGDDQDQLPVLQHALMRTWQNWREEPDPNIPLDISHYEAIGGMANALSVHADKAYSELKKPDEDLQEIAEKLFKCLTVIDNENREVRRATTLHNICTVIKGTAKYSQADFEEVVSVINSFRRLGRTFLMPPFTVKLDENSLLDISHESLIRKWGRLKSWVDEEAKWAHLYRRLAEDAFAGTNFWGGAKLKDMLEWREQFKPSETWAQLYYESWGQEELSTFDEAMKFLDESKRLENKEIAEKERSRVTLERSARNLRFVVAALFVVLLISIGLTVYAFQQRQNIKSLLDDQEKMNFQLTERKKQLEAQNKELDRNKREVEDGNIKLQETFNELEKKKDQLEKNKKDLLFAFTEQKKATETAEINRIEKEKAYERQKELTIDRENARADFEKKAIEADKAKIKSEKTAAREKLNREGLTSFEKGQFKTALKQFEQLLVDYDGDSDLEPDEKTDGKWWSLHNMGAINRQLKNFSDAEKKYKEALGVLGEPQEQIDNLSFEPKNSVENVFRTISYQPLPESDRNIHSKIATLQKLGELHRYRARNGADKLDSEKFNLRATKPYARLIEIFDPHTSEDKFYLADMEIELANIYFDLTDNPNARIYYEKALKIFKTEREANLISIIDIEGKLSRVGLRESYLKEAGERTKKIKEAKEGIRRIIEIRLNELKLPLYHPDMVNIYNDLGNVYLAESNALNDEIEIDLKKFAPPNPPQTEEQKKATEKQKQEVKKLRGKAGAYFALSRTIDYWNQDKITKIKSFSSYSNLATMYSNANECEKAESLYLESINNKDESAEMSAFKLMWIAQFYRSVMLDDVKAEEYYIKFEKKIREPNFSLLNFLDDVKTMGDFYYETRKYDKAGEIYKQLSDEIQKGETTIPAFERGRLFVYLRIRIAHNREAQEAGKEEINKIYKEALDFIKAETVNNKTPDAIFSAKYSDLLTADVLVDQIDYSLRQKDTTNLPKILQQVVETYGKYFTFSASDEHLNWYEEYSYSLQMLGDVKREEKKIDDAVKYYEQALKASNIYNDYIHATPSRYSIKGLNDFYNRRIELLKSWAEMLTGEDRENKLKEAEVEKENLEELINELKTKCESSVKPANSR